MMRTILVSISDCSNIDLSGAVELTGTPSHYPLEFNGVRTMIDRLFAGRSVAGMEVVRLDEDGFTLVHGYKLGPENILSSTFEAAPGADPHDIHRLVATICVMCASHPEICSPGIRPQVEEFIATNQDAILAHYAADET